MKYQGSDNCAYKEFHVGCVTESRSYHGDEHLMPENWCYSCEAVDSDGVHECVLCEQPVCQDHAVICLKCFDVTCEKCVRKHDPKLSDGGRCDTCRDLLAGAA